MNVTFYSSSPFLHNFKLEHDCDGWFYELALLEDSDVILDKFCVPKKSLKFKGELFTGVVFSAYPNGQLKYEMTYKRGTPSKKLFKYFDEQGNMMYEIRIKGRSVTVKNGLSILLDSNSSGVTR